MKLFRALTFLTLCLTFLGLPALETNAFNWNGETVKAVIQNRGKMEAPREFTDRVGTTNVRPGGHNLATRRAMDYAILKAEKNASLKKAMEQVYGETLENMKGQEGFAFQKILWGNFSNEIQTMLDAGEGAEKYAGWYHSVSRARRTDIVGPDGRHSKYWTKEKGHSSSNAIHSMLVSSTGADAATYTQEHTMKLVKEFTLSQLESSITDLVNVMRAKNDGLHVIEDTYHQSLRAVLRFMRNIRKSYEGDNAHYTDSRYEFALRDLGSLFHTVQDSAVGCTEAARNAVVDPVRECLAGDGHSVIERIGREWKIVSFSDQAWYVRQGTTHHKLDNLYQPGNLATVEELVEGRDIEKGVYGSFDPAIPVGNILLEVAEEVASITDKLSGEKAYTPLSDKDQTFLTRQLGNVMEWTGLKLARADSLPPEWKEKLAKHAKYAAERVAEKHVFTRYASQLRPMGPVPTPAGKQAPHGSEK